MVSVHRAYATALDWALLAAAAGCFAGSLLSLAGRLHQDARFLGLLGVIALTWFVLAKLGDRVATQG